MKYLFLPVESKITPKEVLEEIDKFEYINKSPYSLSYYNTPNISWDYKPQGSLRISDHWNFTSHGEKHCLLAHTEKNIQNNWMLAEYIDEKYHVLKEFGERVDGYRFLKLNENDIKMLSDLYYNFGIINSKDWYKKYTLKPPLARESHIRSRKVVAKIFDKDKLKEFKEKNKNAKKVVFLEEKNLSVIKKAIEIYKESEELERLCLTEDGREALINQYNAYDFKEEDFESFDKKFMLVLNDNMVIDFKDELI